MNATINAGLTASDVRRILDRAAKRTVIIDGVKVTHAQGVYRMALRHYSGEWIMGDERFTRQEMFEELLYLLGE